ncbi:MAG: transposase [Chitinophagaceae bacterium]|nr:transposase [Chitinophagaceae bacterium]
MQTPFYPFANAQKFNCYAGLAPFAHKSGTIKKSLGSAIWQIKKGQDT